MKNCTIEAKARDIGTNKERVKTTTPTTTNQPQQQQKDSNNLSQISVKVEKHKTFMICILTGFSFIPFL